MPGSRKTRGPRPVRVICAGYAGRTRAGQESGTPAGQYLKSYDPEAHDGQGASEWTWNAAEAMTFPGIAAAAECWRQVPRCRPVRADGKPNRPLTAFSITFEAVTDVS